MPRVFSHLIICLFTFTLATLQADDSNKESSAKTTQIFRTFTGKVCGSKVRMRTSPDLEGHIICQLNKNDLVLISKDANDFWAVQPPSDVKAYVFRSYVIDNTIEANRVNLRISPNLDAQIIGQLQSGDKVEGKICEEDAKWLEISMPSNINFYVAKEYISYAGDEKYLSTMQTRKSEVETLLNSAYFITQAECKKPFDEMTPQEAVEKFDLIIKEYSDFQDHVQQAKEGLALLQDNYLQKKIAYLEAKANISQTEKNELLSAIEKVNKPKNEIKVEKQKVSNAQLTNKMKFWEPIEKALYLTWSTFHPEKKLDDFYNEQSINATIITGVVESYDNEVHNKPGNFIVKSDNIPKAYIYSTKVNLEQYVGKEVELKVSPRPNNNFAFPAYFVNAIE